METDTPVQRPVSTQEANPANAVNRTAFALILALFPVVNIVLVTVNEWAVDNATLLPGWLFPVLNGALAVSALFALLITRLMAIPGVNEWLRDGKVRSILAPDKELPAATPEAPATPVPGPADSTL